MAKVTRDFRVLTPEYMNKVTRKGGHTCERCGRRDRLYLRSLDRAMMHYLMLMCARANRTKGGWVYIPDLTTEPGLAKLGKSRSYSKLALFGFAEQREERKADGNPRNGYWRATVNGHLFLHNKISAPAHIIIHANRVIGVVANEAPIYARDVKSKGFNFKESMSAFYPNMKASDIPDEEN